MKWGRYLATQRTERRLSNVCKLTMYALRRDGWWKPVMLNRDWPSVQMDYGPVSQPDLYRGMSCRTAEQRKRTPYKNKCMFRDTKQSFILCVTWKCIARRSRDKKTQRFSGMLWGWYSEGYNTPTIGSIQGAKLSSEWYLLVSIISIQ